MSAKTIVDCCNNRVPVRYWKDAVKYDAWGRPYVTDGDRITPFVVVVCPDGNTDRPSIKWKHRSGPPVSFPDEQPPMWGRP